MIYPSVQKGLIDPDHLALAGDGTPVCTAAQQRKKRICSCKENGCSSCNCKRHYSLPDCNWIPPMTLILSMSTADGKISRRLSISIPATPDISLIRTISPLMRTVSRSAGWAYVCIKMDMRLPNTGRNTDVRKRTANRAASVSIPAHRRNTTGPYTSLPMTIQGYLTHRQGTAKHGKGNITEGLPWNAPTSVRKRTIN